MDGVDVEARRVARHGVAVACSGAATGSVIATIIARRRRRGPAAGRGTPRPASRRPRTPTAAGRRGSARSRARRADRRRLRSARSSAVHTAHARVRHLVFERAAVALPRVAPVVLGDELGLRAGDERLRRAVTRWRRRRSARPRCCQRYATAPPARGSRSMACAIAHREVGLVVDPARDGGDGPARHQLADEHDGPPQRAVLGDAAHVEAQVHLVEAAMARDRHAGEPRVLEAEADEADERLPEPRVERRCRRARAAPGAPPGRRS